MWKQSEDTFQCRWWNISPEKEHVSPPNKPLTGILDQFSVFLHSKSTTIQENLDTELLEASENIPPVLPIEDPISGGKLNTFRILTSDDVQPLNEVTNEILCPHPFPIWLPKLFTKCLLPTMTHIIYKSLESSILLNTLKEARVTLWIKNIQSW